jgi:hypothetical protein
MKDGNVCIAYTERMQRLYCTGVIPYCYVFTNTNTRIGYKKMFELVFAQLAQAARTIIHWPHIHGTDKGLRTIGLDMCNKQAGGMHIKYALHMEY